MINEKSPGISGLGVIADDSVEPALWQLAPISLWSEVKHDEHLVQFYEADAFLLNSLSGFVRTGLASGEAVFVVATRAHRDRLAKLLHEGGIDLGKATASGQFVALDAAETLSRFMVAGLPDASQFREVLGNLIACAVAGHTGGRIFGEMVALLWGEGNCEAATRLERMWNELQEIYPFLLFCAYPINECGGEDLAGPVSDICGQHSRVIPAESYSAVPSPDDRLRVILRLQQKARSLEAEVAERKRAEETIALLHDDLQQRLEERELLLVRERMARAEAEGANRLKDEFLATVSHELRTPLNAIIGWSHMLRSGRLDAATSARAIETIERNGKSQAQLIEDILDVSRVITGKLRLNLSAVDMAAIINAAIDSVQLAADAKDIHLAVTLDPSARHVSGDLHRLQQVIWNLLANAIKFTPKGGRVEVRMERADDCLQINVSDTGQGISSQFLPFIFDRFRQADGTTTRNHGGLGLGLAIVRHLVELHGGTVKANSEGDGRGTTFTVQLPLATAQKQGSSWAEPTAEPEQASGILKPVPTLQNVRVLLVDDDKDTLHMLTVTLSEYNAKVQTAGSVAEALSVLEWFKPDVLVSDLAMPEEDGYSLIAKIRTLPAENDAPTPAVALTSHVRVEDRARALAAGFNMFVPKPVEPNELISAIANLAQAG